MKSINPYRQPQLPKHLEIFHPWIRRDLPQPLLERLYQDCVVDGNGIAWPNGQGYVVQINAHYWLPDEQRHLYFEIAFDLWIPGYAFIWRLNRADNEPETYDPEELMTLLEKAEIVAPETIRLSEENNP